MAENFTNARTFSGEPLAFSIENGRFVEVCRHIPDAQDLQGATVLPGFIDAHCHILPTGIDLQRLNLGKCEHPDEILDAVRDWVPKLKDGEWLMAVHYDQTKFADVRHMHRSQLDAVCPDVPVVLRHVNGHASVVNTAVFTAASVTKDTPDPKGGEFVRDASGELTGVVLEKAHELLTGKAPSPSLEQRIDAIKRAVAAMLPYGVTSASDMMTGYSDLEQEVQAYVEAARSGLPFRTRLYVQWSALFGPKAADSSEISALFDGTDHEMCRIAGVKIFADGAIGSATAAVYEEFQSGGLGTMIYAPERLTKMVQTAHESGWQIAVHTIGDRSTDHVLEAFESTDDPARHRLEHAMILSDAQIERIKKSGCHVAMQPEFLVRFAHSYKKQLQPHVYPRLKRVRSCLEAGIPMSFNSDRPIVSGDPWSAIRSAVARPEGYDQGENISLVEAVALYTHGGAVANRENERYGLIEEGAHADFQIYSSHPVPQESPKPNAVYVGGKLAWDSQRNALRT